MVMRMLPQYSVNRKCTTMTSDIADKLGTFTIDDREVDIRAGETLFRAARRLGIKLPHLVLSAQARLPPGRQLPRLHGGDRGRARARRELHPERRRRA